MSRLLFAEPYFTHFRRKYLGFIGTVILAYLMVVPTYFIYLDYDPEYGWQGVAVLLWIGIMMLVLLVIEILASLATQRFEIYDDRIAVPDPRGFSLLRPKRRTIVKKEVRYAVLDYLEQAGAFQTEINGEPYHGPKGEWRCIFHFENRETYVLTSYDVRPSGLIAFFLPLRLQYTSNRCVPALKEFVGGLEE